MADPGDPQRPDVAFVLGGGGVLGAAEVGMLQALAERGVWPDVVLGTSIGAVNGAILAADPSTRTIQALAEMWGSLDAGDLLGSMRDRITTAARTQTHLHSDRHLRAVLERHLHGRRIEELQAPFQCVAASIERAAEHWFTEGPVIDAVLASCAVPGMFPPTRIGDEHFFDGGLVHSIPVGRALALGATTIYVLQVGRVERPLEPPRRPWEVASVAFEIARRHRFAADMSSVPDDVSTYVLPTGSPVAPAGKDLSSLKYWERGAVPERIRLAYEASCKYLDSGRPDKPGTADDPSGRVPQ